MSPITLLSYVHSTCITIRKNRDLESLIGERLLPTPPIPRATLYYARSIDYNFDSIRVLQEYEIIRGRIDVRNDTIHRPAKVYRSYIGCT